MTDEDWKAAPSEEERLARWYQYLNQVAADLRRKERERQSEKEPPSQGSATASEQRSAARLAPTPPTGGNAPLPPDRTSETPADATTTGIGASAQQDRSLVSHPPHAASALVPRLAARASTGPQPAKRSVVLLHRRYARPDESVLHLLERRLVAEGYAVFLDRHLFLSSEWMQEAKKRIGTADAVIVLLSAASVHSEALVSAVQWARQVHDRDPLKARILAVRLRYDEELPEPLHHGLDVASFVSWQSPEDDERVANQILQALQAQETPGASPLAPAEAVAPTHVAEQDASVEEMRGSASFLQHLPPQVRQRLLSPESETAQRYYTRPFKETRAQLIERLLDPPLTLEETARLLNVCPMTVRRYTDRGLLPHYRTAGAQRRFRLSDVLAFLEKHGPLQTKEPPSDKE